MKMPIYVVWVKNPGSDVPFIYEAVDDETLIHIPTAVEMAVQKAKAEYQRAEVRTIQYEIDVNQLHQAFGMPVHELE